MCFLPQFYLDQLGIKFVLFAVVLFHSGTELTLVSLEDAIAARGNVFQVRFSIETSFKKSNKQTVFTLFPSATPRQEETHKSSTSVNLKFVRVCRFI